MPDDTDMQADRPKRIIRSFVLRQGRSTPSQKRAFEQHWNQYGLAYTGEKKDFARIFPNAGELVMEIGFGNGEQLAFAAEQEPQRNFIGIEVHPPGVGRALNSVAENTLGNVRLYQHDAVEVLNNEIEDASLAEARIYFPDPWHKKRHHKRRIIQPDFVRMLCRKLKPGGRLHLATDWQEYVEHMWEVCDAEPLLQNSAGPQGAIARPAWRRQTHFETRGRKLGHDVWDLLYIRRGEA